MSTIQSSTCVACGTTEVTTLGTPLCSPNCRSDWAQETFNNMSDDEAYCPFCKDGFHSVKDAIYHANHTHNGTYNRTSECEYCGVEFTPTNSANPNKYCSEACFGLSDSGGRPHDGFITYECSRKGCDETNTVTRAIRRLMSDEAYCSPECGVPRMEEHWNWQGGSDKIRRSPEYRRWTKAIHQSGDECESCGNSTNLHAHHTIPVSDEPWKALDPSNGELLCDECHASRHPDLPEGLILS